MAVVTVKKKKKSFCHMPMNQHQIKLVTLGKLRDRTLLMPFWFQLGIP